MIEWKHNMIIFKPSTSWGIQLPPTFHYGEADSHLKHSVSDLLAKPNSGSWRAKAGAPAQILVIIQPFAKSLLCSAPRSYVIPWRPIYHLPGAVERVSLASPSPCILQDRVKLKVGGGEGLEQTTKFSKLARNANQHTKLGWQAKRSCK